MFPFDDVIMENTSADTSVLISVKIFTLAIRVDYGVESFYAIKLHAWGAIIYQKYNY